PPPTAPRNATGYGALSTRHAGAPRRPAYTLAHCPADADDLVAETFAKVLAVLRAGRGPDAAFRAYLHTTLRHVRYDRVRRDRRIEFTDDLSRYEQVVPFHDTTIARLERLHAARAFAKLPERWRTVLWHTAIEGEPHAQVAPLLGLTPGGVAALAFRARERLRQIYEREAASAG
ncbi:sigma-70 family RNA polymerase sigma factor, partial [Micromonospora sp. CPCC 205371]|nr:sigma-70 family RNA polymerase sigma factor [Micromonospora sp. CPCC 205371]